MIQLSISSAPSSHPVTTRRRLVVYETNVSARPLYLQLNYFLSIRLEALLCLQTFRPGDFTTIQSAQLRESNDDVISVAGEICGVANWNQLKCITCTIILMSSPVHGFPVRKSSRNCTLPFKVSTLVKSPTKFNVRSNFCSDSHPSRFSIFSTLFMARFRYSSFFNLARFSGRLQGESEWKSEPGKSKLNYYQFSGSSSTAGEGFSAHGIAPECFRFAQYSPDAEKAPRGWRWAARCAPTFCGWVAR